MRSLSSSIPIRRQPGDDGAGFVYGLLLGQPCLHVQDGFVHDQDCAVFLLTSPRNSHRARAKLLHTAQVSDEEFGRSIVNDTGCVLHDDNTPSAAGHFPDSGPHGTVGRLFCGACHLSVTFVGLSREQLWRVGNEDYRHDGKFMGGGTARYVLKQCRRAQGWGRGGHPRAVQFGSAKVRHFGAGCLADRRRQHANKTLIRCGESDPSVRMDSHAAAVTSSRACPDSVRSVRDTRTSHRCRPVQARCQRQHQAQNQKQTSSLPPLSFAPRASCPSPLYDSLGRRVDRFSLISAFFLSLSQSKSRLTVRSGHREAPLSAGGQWH